MISLIRLIDGTELIGDTQKSSDKITIINPFQINYYFKNPASLPVVAMHKYMPFSSDSTFSFYADQILVHTSARKSAQEYYKTLVREHSDGIDDMIDEELFDKSEILDTETKEIAAAVLERAIKKPLLN